MTDSSQPPEQNRPFQLDKPTDRDITHTSDGSIPSDKSQPNPAPWTISNSLTIIGIFIAIILFLAGAYITINVVPHLDDSKIKDNVRIQWIEAEKYEKAGNFEKAIEIHSAILNEINKNDFPYEYAKTQFLLGTDHLQLSLKDPNPEENLYYAISSLNTARVIFEQQKNPAECAATDANLGLAYSKWSSIRNSEENLRKSIILYNSALNYYTPNNDAIAYIGILSNLGYSYYMLSDLDQKNQTEYFETGRDSVYKAAVLAQLLKNEDPILHANLLINHALFLKSEDAKLRAYREAQKTFSLESYPDDYARAQIWIGNVYFDYAPPLDETYIQKSIDYYHDALRTLKKYPLQEAYINQKLGLAYGRMGMIKEREKYLQKSDEFFSKALEFYTRDDYPLEYANTQACLGTTYLFLGDLQTNLSQKQIADNAFSEANSIITPETYPIYYQKIKQRYDLFQKVS